MKCKMSFQGLTLKMFQCEVQDSHDNAGITINSSHALTQTLVQLFLVTFIINNQL